MRDREATVESLLNRFVADVPGVAQALAVGTDGLLIASSYGVDRARADTAAAITAHLLGLAARSAALLHGGQVAMAMIEMDTGFLFLMGLPDGSAVVGWADRTCDVGQTGYEFAALADRLS